MSFELSGGNDERFDVISAFENYRNRENEDGGHVVVTTRVVDSSLQLLWQCPWWQISGLVVISWKRWVTLQSSINYLKAGKLDDVLTIKGENVSIMDAQPVSWMSISPIKKAEMSAR